MRNNATQDTSQLSDAPYPHLAGKFIDSYNKTGLIFDPNVWLDENHAAPLVALAFSLDPREKFFGFSGKFFDSMAVYQWGLRYFGNNFLWYGGFTGGLFRWDRKERREPCYYRGYSIGRDTRRFLLEYYFDG